MVPRWPIKTNIHDFKLMLYAWCQQLNAKTDSNNHMWWLSNVINVFVSNNWNTNARNTLIYMVKWFCSLTMLPPMLQSGSRDLETYSPDITLSVTIITCFDQWNTTRLTSTSSTEFSYKSCNFQNLHLSLLSSLSSTVSKKSSICFFLMCFCIWKITAR